MRRHHLDARLDWQPRHDPRSRGYAVDAVLPDRPARIKRCWQPGGILDQGREGACVGFAWAGELAASPMRSRMVDNLFALRVYNAAKDLDEWEGSGYSGTSVLAGAKAVQRWGWIGQYRWGFSLEDLRDAVLHLGPAVIGIPWPANAYEPRPSGLLDIGGPIVGGHAILVVGYHPGMRIAGEGWNDRHEVFALVNSWGEGYGKKGLVYVRAADLWGLLADDGEICIPLQRYRKGNAE